MVRIDPPQTNLFARLGVCFREKIFSPGLEQLDPALDKIISLTGLSLATIAMGVWVWAKQWTVQYLVHRGAFGAVSGAAPAASPDIAVRGIDPRANVGKAFPPDSSVKS